MVGVAEAAVWVGPGAAAAWGATNWGTAPWGTAPGGTAPWAGDGGRGAPTDDMKSAASQVYNQASHGNISMHSLQRLHQSCFPGTSAREGLQLSETPTDI